tara:strand:- start:237 stop:692 length:456 start_codon:yes stop_codon:yes gene_type:complete
MPIATSSEKVDLFSENQTKELANKFSKKIAAGDTVFLYGEIGVGKTTFIRYVINFLQKDNNLDITEVTSPTFNILNEYQINEIKIYHYDLFRLKSAAEIKNLDLFEENLNVIKLIEWPQIIKEKPQNLIELTFNYEEDHNKRSVQIKGLKI